MKKIFKILKYIFLIIISILIVFFFYSYIYNKIVSGKESKYISNFNIGEKIIIDGQVVNYKIFNENNNQNTIVLMSGYGFNDLSLSFEPLAKKLNAKIVLINRPGYGYSIDTNDNATIDYIVNYYRNVIKHIGITEKLY